MSVLILDQNSIASLAKHIESNINAKYFSNMTWLEIADALYSFNATVYNRRYNQDTLLHPTFSYPSRASLTQHFKWVLSWLYQCAEDGYDNHPLYKAMEELSKSIAIDIISNTDDYINASWT